MIEYASILILAVLAAAVALLMLFVSPLLRWGAGVFDWLTGARGTANKISPKRPNPVKSQPFECGVEPIALPAGRLPVHFYVVAMLFVVFDVELVFLFPWAVLVRELGWFGLLEMGFFLAVVVAGFVYAWKHGALEFK